jgi:hypothetical protein
VITVTLVELVAVPAGVVTLIGPVDAVMAGPVAVILEDEFRAEDRCGAVELHRRGAGVGSTR